MITTTIKDTGKTGDSPENPIENPTEEKKLTLTEINRLNDDEYLEYLEKTTIFDEGDPTEDTSGLVEVETGDIAELDDNPAAETQEIPEETTEETTETLPEDGLEQSTQNSSTDPDKDATSDDEEVTPDVTEADTEEATDTETTEESDTSKELYKIKANGQDIEVTLDDLKALAKKGANYTKKMQDLASKRDTLALIENADISDTDLDLLLDAHSGDKKALQKLLEKSNVSPIDLDDEELKNTEYKSKQTRISDAESKLLTVIDTIQDEPEFARTKEILTDLWDEASKAEILNNPKHLLALHSDVKDGTFDRVYKLSKGAGLAEGGLETDLRMYLKYAAQVEKAKEKPTTNSKTPSPKVTAKSKNVPSIADLTKQLEEMNTTKQNKTQAQITKAVKKQANNKAATSVNTTTTKKVVDMTQLTDQEFTAFFDAN